MILRKCWVCKTELELNSDNFYKDKKDIDLFQRSCKNCQKKRNAQYNKEHLEYFKYKGKEAYQKKLNTVENYNKFRYSQKKEEYLTRKFNYERTLNGKLKNLLYSARDRAKKYNLEFNIDLEYLVELYNKNKGCCSLTNIEFDVSKNDERYKNSHFYPTSISLDKINSSEGYTKDNVRLVITAINLALNEFGTEFFENMICNYIIHNQDKKVFENY